VVGFQVQRRQVRQARRGRLAVGSAAARLRGRRRGIEIVVRGIARARRVVVFRPQFERRQVGGRQVRGGDVHRRRAGRVGDRRLRRGGGHGGRRRFGRRRARGGRRQVDIVQQRALQQGVGLGQHVGWRGRRGCRANGGNGLGRRRRVVGPQPVGADGEFVAGRQGHFLVA